MLKNLRRIDKIYSNTLKNKIPESLLELKNTIINENEIESAFNYLKDFEEDNEIIWFLLSNVSNNNFILENLINFLGTDVIVNKLIYFDDINLILKVINAKEIVDDINFITTIEDFIVSNNNVINMYLFAINVKNSDKEKLAKAIIETKNAMYIRKMAEAFPNLVQLLSEEILETENISEIIKFMLTVRGCPLGYMLKTLRIDSTGKIILVSELLKQDVVKYHFYADAIINNKNLLAQDETYMQYCQSNGNSLEKILLQDLQLKNHAKIIKKVYKK